MDDMRQRVLADEGMTLVEVLLVVVVLGILAAVVAFAVQGLTGTGNEAACRSDQKTAEAAVEAYYAKNQAYAPDLQTLEVQGLLRSTHPDGGGGYTITYDPSSGAVGASGACTVAN